jgi:putative tryptophan/tyrosine transport system substrate-binding protein
MRRRDLIALLGGAALARPTAAGAQQGERVRRVGVLMTYAESDAEAQSWVAAFREALRPLGWSENRNLAIEVRWAPGGRAVPEGSAQALVAAGPDLILASTTPATTALLQQTRTIPIVFVLVSDPVGSGFVASFPRPGGNVTGFTTMEPTMAASGWSC